MIRSGIFNFHSVRSVIIAKLKTKRRQRTDVCAYKTERGRDGNVMFIRMYKPHTNIIELMS